MRREPAKPGWYNDPKGVYKHQAYWNGTDWTGYTRPSTVKEPWWPMLTLLVFLPLDWVMMALVSFPIVALAIWKPVVDLGAVLYWVCVAALPATLIYAIAMQRKPVTGRHRKRRYSIWN